MRFTAYLLSKSRWLSWKTKLHSVKSIGLAMRVQIPIEAKFFFFFFFIFFLSFFHSFQPFTMFWRNIWKKKCNYFNEILCWIYKVLFSLYFFFLKYIEKFISQRQLEEKNEKEIEKKKEMEKRKKKKGKKEWICWGLNPWYWLP